MSEGSVTVRWRSGEMIVPPYGLMVHGRIVEVAYRAAANLERQGLVDRVEVTPADEPPKPKKPGARGSARSNDKKQAQR